MLEAEKRAFLARAATAPARALGKTYWRAAQNAPVSTAMATAGTLALAPLAMQGDDPEAARQNKIKKMRRRQLAAQAGGLGMKTASIHFDAEEVRQALCIRRQLEKTAKVKALAALGKPHELFAAGLMLGAGTGIAGAGVAGASYGVGKLSEMAHASGRNKRYSAMLQADPTLKRDPKSRAFFNILDKASPYISGEPLVAASAVRTMIESPEGYGAAPRMMKDILGVESERQKTRFPGLRAPTFKAELPDMD